MSDVVDLHPARSVEFEGEMQVLTDRFSVALYEVLALLEAIGPGGEPHFSRLLRMRARIIHAMETISDHVSCIEEEMDRIFEVAPDGQLLLFQTYDDRVKAIISSRLTTRCHSIRVQQIRSRPVMGVLHNNDEIGFALPKFG